MRAFVFACDAINAFESLHNKIENETGGRGSSLQTATFVNQLVMAGCTIAEIGALAGGRDHAALRNIKSLEFFSRLLSVPLRIISAEEKLSQQEDVSGLKKAAIRVQTLTGSLADVVRVGAELRGYAEGALKDAYQSDPNAQRLAYIRDPDAEDADEYGWVTKTRPIDPEECEMKIAAAQSCAREAARVKCIMDLKVPEKVAEGMTRVGIGLYNRLSVFLRQAIMHAGHPAVDPALNPDLLALERIPHPLHGDEIFSQYICAITREPIRDPVRDPDGHTLYERSAIRNWLAFRQSSPATGAPMTEANLEEMLAIKVIIDQRLLFHGRALIRSLANNQSESHG